MKLMAKFSTVVLSGLFMLASSVAIAQGMGMGKAPGMPSFTEFDIDGDGVIVEDELYKARAERIAKHAQEGRKMKNLKNAPAFADIDTNGDGGISSAEFSAHQAEHRAARKAEKQQAKEKAPD